MASRITAYLRNNVLGLVALFIALGAGAYAAGLPKNSVKSKQIKAGAVKTDELADNAVTSPKVADGSLNSGDFAAGQLPAFNGAAAGGALNGTYPNPSLAAPEAVHIVGTPGEPPFAAGASHVNSFVPTGFYKDGFGIVHLQGTVNTGPTSSRVFTLPAGYRPAEDVCMAVPAFSGGSTFTFNRACVDGGTGDVNNDRGTGTSFVGLDGITFRP